MSTPRRVEVFPFPDTTLVTCGHRDCTTDAAVRLIAYHDTGQPAANMPACAAHVDGATAHMADADNAALQNALANALMFELLHDSVDTGQLPIAAFEDLLGMLPDGGPMLCRVAAELCRFVMEIVALNSEHPEDREQWAAVFAASRDRAVEEIRGNDVYRRSGIGDLDEYGDDTN